MLNNKYRDVQRNIMLPFLLCLMIFHSLPIFACTVQSMKIYQSPKVMDKQALQTLLQLLEVDVTPCQRSPDMPEHLKISNDNSPTPPCVPGGHVVNSIQLKQWLDLAEADTHIKAPILFDVLDDDVHPHYSLPNAYRLPMVGRGAVDILQNLELEKYLFQLTQKDKNVPIVFFCKNDCWHAWNAVQRSREYGYQHAFWYRSGTHSWAENEWPLVVLEPITLQSVADTY